MLGFTQKMVADQLGVVPWTILNWEKGHTEPLISAFPAILEFLGYDPYPAPATVPDHLVSKRRRMGWTIKEAAEVVGVDPSTWGDWERGRIVLYRQHRALIAIMLGLSVEDFNQEMTEHWIRSHERAL